jgi:hypothetical protein
MATMMVDDSSDDDNIVQFPATEAERRAMRKLQQDQERQRLVNVFVDNDRALFHDPNGVAYADIIINGHRETWPVKSKEFRSCYIGYLQRQLARLVSEGSILAMGVKLAMSKNAVNAAINDFEIRAISSTATVRSVYVRVAGHGNDIYVDLCNANWEAVRVTAAGWNIVTDPPVRFRRARGMKPLPHPEHGGSIETLRPFLNVTTDQDFAMAVGWLVAAMRPNGPYPILNLYGEHGSAKSYFFKVLRALFDPHTVMVSRLPLSSRDLFIAAGNSHMQMFGNVSKITDAMSDDLCRLATGEGARTRALFTDKDEALFDGERPIGIEGIARTVDRPDLLSRSIVLVIEPLAEFVSQRELWAKFEGSRASIFGALLTLVAQGVDKLPATRLTNAPPRMADFTLWAVACGIAKFESAYARNRQAAIDVMLEHDPLARALRAFMADRKKWTGISEDLLDAIGPAAGIKSTQALSDRLRHLAPPLRSIGLNIVSEPRQAKRRPLRIEWMTPMTPTP